MSPTRNNYAPSLCADREAQQYSHEILEYFETFYRDENLAGYVKLEHKVLGARWHGDRSLWEVEIEHYGKITKDWCNILMNGSGLLNRWKCM